MPTPEGFITTSDIWQPSPEAQLEDANIPFEKIEAEEDVEDLAAYDAAVADPDPGIPFKELTEEEKKEYTKANQTFVFYKYKLGQFDAFNEANAILKNPKAYSPEEYTSALMFYKAIRDRKDVVQKAYNKILYTSQLVGYHKDKKILTFAGNNEFTDGIYAEVQQSHGIS